MDSTDAADLIAEIHEERAENDAQESFRNRAALLIATLAAILAIGGMGGGNATDAMIENNIKASDTWAFFQAKNIRQTMYEIEAEKLEAQIAAGNAPAGAAERLADYKATAARYDSEPDPEAPDDPLRGEGKKQLSAQARAYEAAFAEASTQDESFDYAEVCLQLALVLGSVAILAVNRWILAFAATLGLIGTLLTANGFLLLVPLS